MFSLSSLMQVHYSIKHGSNWGDIWRMRFFCQVLGVGWVLTQSSQLPKIHKTCVHFRSVRLCVWSRVRKLSLGPAYRIASFVCCRNITSIILVYRSSSQSESSWPSAIWSQWLMPSLYGTTTVRTVRSTPSSTYVPVVSVATCIGTYRYRKLRLLDFPYDVLVVERRLQVP